MSSTRDLPGQVVLAPEQVPAEVVEKAAAGDRAAQEAVLEGTSTFVRRMLYKLIGRVDDLEDLQQTVLMRIVTGLPRWRRESALSTWVGGICVNVSRDYLRQRRTRSVELDGEPAERALQNRPASSDLQGEAEAREELRRCRSALDRLSVNHRTAFVLKTLGHSVEEIAQMTGSATSTTRLRLYYARKAFTRALAATAPQAEGA